MKTTIVKVSGILRATLALAFVYAPVAGADDHIAVKVPFTFIVGETRLPAGSYVVREVPDEVGVVEITSTDGRRSAYVLTVPAEASQLSRPELVFEKFSNQYFLARVRPERGEEQDVVLTPGRMAHEIAKAAAN
jgi:hypothetical protein